MMVKALFFCDFRLLLKTVCLLRAKYNTDILKIDMDSLGKIAPYVIIMKQIYNTQANGKKRKRNM